MGKFLKHRHTISKIYKTELNNFETLISHWDQLSEGKRKIYQECAVCLLVLLKSKKYEKS